MATHITARKTWDLRADSRPWLRGEHGTDPGSQRNYVLDFALFTGANFADGYIPNGTVLAETNEADPKARRTGPYDPAATDGRNVAKFIAWNSCKIPADRTEVHSDAGFIHGFVDETRLPFKSGAGALDANARTALSHIIWQ